MTETTQLLCNRELADRCFVLAEAIDDLADDTDTAFNAAQWTKALTLPEILRAISMTLDGGTAYVNAGIAEAEAFIREIREMLEDSEI